MKNVTIRLSDEKVKTLDGEADDLDLSRAEYLRELVEKGRESRAVEDELERVGAKPTDSSVSCGR
jgi:predicted DNA-binding protein